MATSKLAPVNIDNGARVPLGRGASAPLPTGSADVGMLDPNVSQGYDIPKSISNLKVHPALVGNRPTWFGAPIERGRLTVYSDFVLNTGGGATTLTPAANAKTITFYFVFNPTSVSLGFHTDPNAPTTLTSDPTDNSPKRFGVNNLNFSLLVDRSFEVLEDPESRGVLEDVKVLEALGGATGANSGEVTNLEQRPVEVRFGGARAFHFYGLFNSLDIEFSHFTPAMVPTRMGVSISMQRLSDLVSGGEFMASNFFDVQKELKLHPDKTKPKPPRGSGGVGSRPA